jgi:hypothetical protein
MCSRCFIFSTEILWLQSNSLEGDIGPIINALPITLIELELDANIFTGTIPPSIGTFTDLNFLDFGGNTFKGTIPNELGLLSKLTSLDFGGNNLSGTIPNQLGLLSKLNYLGLHSNGFTGTVPTSLANLALLSKSTQFLVSVLLRNYCFSRVCILHTEKLFLFDNDLTGSLNAFCSIHYEFFAANTCGQVEIECTCCTHCCNLDSTCDPI